MVIYNLLPKNVALEVSLPSFYLYLLTLIQFQDFEQSIRTGHCDVTLLLVPGNAVEFDIVGNRYL